MQPSGTSLGTGQEAASRQVLQSLMAVQGWFRETTREVLPQHSGASLALLALLDRRGQLRASVLADIARVDPSVVSRQVAHLVDAGLVERHPDPDDRRAQLLRLSPAGRQVLADGRDRMLAVVEERLADWDAEELSHFAARLVRLIDDLST